ncbi:PQQ-dependent sugar dehydrogenase [Geodermatophilus sp. SYSU D00691]
MRSAGLLAALLLLTACTGGGGDGGASAAGTTSPQPPVSEPPPTAPPLDVAVVADGLDHPWDVAQAPDGTLLVGERGGGFTAVLPDGTAQEVAADLDDLFARGETGQMGLVLDPGFADNRRFYSCQGRQGGEVPDIAVLAWTVDEDWTSATRVADPLLGGIPVNSSSGRHGGCRLRFDPTGALLVSTGDNAVGSNPQDRTSLAGKVLRVDPATGGPAAGNPFTGSGAEPYVWTYGHRNVQGLAVRPRSGEVYAVEQGTGRDDEVNLLVAGSNYGWDPGPDGYDESVPMTDPEIPGAVPAVWSSGDPTIATCGGTFLSGEEWGAYDGLLLVAVLKDQGVLALRLDDDGRLVEQFRLPELDGTHGRIRAVQQGTDGALYVTTDNGDDADVLLRVTPGS